VGPRDGGMTPMGGRPVQEVRPIEATPQREAVRPPAAATPQMVEPLPQAPPKKTPPPVKKAPAQARGATPTRGEEVQTGSAIAETGGRGQGFGLTSGGGGTGAQLDVGDFCCPEYLATMQQMIQRNWSAKQQVAGTTVMTFVIQRDGTLTGITLRQSSGFAALDLTAQRALVLTRQLPALPGEFPEPMLTVHLSFNYVR
jgi:periplasmic protein TonB